MHCPILWSGAATVSVRSWLASLDRLCLDPTHVTSVLSALSWSQCAAHQLMKSAEQSDSGGHLMKRLPWGGWGPITTWFRIMRRDRDAEEGVGGVEPLPSAYALRNKRVRMPQNMVFSTKNTKQILVRGHSPLPRPFSRWGGGYPSPCLIPLAFAAPRPLPF